MRGHAPISQLRGRSGAESDRISGSFFTHSISGLHGAADSTRDGQVSLNRCTTSPSMTLARTENTRAGRSTSCNIQLTGTAT
jgi:hypothetical protein